MIGPGHFVLIGKDVDPLAALSPAARAAWVALDGVGVTIGMDGHRDVDGAYAAWFANLGAIVVLVQPDFQVFGTSADVADAHGLVTALADALQLKEPVA